AQEGGRTQRRVLPGRQEAGDLQDLLEIGREEEGRVPGKGEAVTESSPVFFARTGSRSGLPGALAEKRAKLEEILRGLGRVLVAYSGGVDSAVLLAESHRVLGVRACGGIALCPSLAAAWLHDALPRTG